MSDVRLSAPSALRNRDPILAVLRGVLPKAGVVLEIASGTGEHVVHFAAHLPELIFQPSDPDAARSASVDAWAEGAGNIRPALALDVLGAWPALSADAVVCINMIHIAPWDATLGLMRGAAAVLPAGGPLVLYGPYRQGGRHTAPSNADFDADLRVRDAGWGIRDLEDVARVAFEAGFGPPDIVPMPANNLCVVFRRRG